VTYDPDLPHSLTNRLDGLQHPPHGTPAEPIAAHIKHPVLFVSKVQWEFPCRVIPMEKERADVGPPWVEGGLEYGVGKPLVQLRADAAIGNVEMVVVAI
jgi:hypothetical protein